MERLGYVASWGNTRQVPAIAAEAEGWGYESAWVAETAGYDVATMMAAIATATSGIRIGTGIAGIFLRDPLLMAMTANAVNELSGGRVILGLGTSTPVIVERWHGVPWSRPLGHMREYTALVRRLLAGERVTSEGLYRLQGAQLAVRSAGVVPIYFGALNPGMLALVGEVADGVILNFATQSYARRAVATIREAEARAGRAPGSVTITAFVRTTVTDDPAAVLPRYRRELLSYILSPVYRRVFTEDGYGEVCDQVNELWSTGKRAEATAAIDERMAFEHNTVGPAAECAAQYRAFREAGIDVPMVFPILNDGEPSPAEAFRGTLTAMRPGAS